MSKDYFDTAKAAGQTYFKELSLFFTFFVLVVTISNLTYQIFGFKLIPIVKTAFDAFHDWCQLVLHLLVFSWVTYCLEFIWHGLTWIASLVSSIIPNWPNITVPSLVTDIALISLAFTRVFQSADLIVPRKDREEAESRMTSALWKEIERAEGPFWGPVHRLLDRTNARIWRLIDAIQNVVTFPFRRFPRCYAIVRPVLVTLAGSILMWGFIRLGGYVINVYAARRLTSPIMEVRRKFFKFFGLSLLAAVLVTLLFILFNGWIAEWMEP